MLQFQFQESMASISDVANSISDVANSILDVAISILDLHQFLQMFLLKKTSDESMSQLKAWKLYQSTLHLCTWWEAIWRCFAQWNPFYIRPCITGRFISITSHLKQAGSRLSGPICLSAGSFGPQRASSKRSCANLQTVAVASHLVKWMAKAAKGGCRFPMAKANEAGKKSLYRPRKRWFLWFVEWFFENKLLLLGFGHMLIFYNTPSFFDSLLSKSVRVTGRCCTCRLIDFDSVCRTSCSWMIQTLYATQAKLLCYGDNKDEMTTKWAFTAISRVTRRVITPQERGPITHLPIC